MVQIYGSGQPYTTSKPSCAQHVPQNLDSDAQCAVRCVVAYQSVRHCLFGLNEGTLSFVRIIHIYIANRRACTLR